MTNSRIVPARDVIEGDILTNGRRVLEVDLVSNVHGRAIIRTGGRWSSRPTGSLVTDPDSPVAILPR